MQKSFLFNHSHGICHLDIRIELTDKRGSLNKFDVMCLNWLIWTQQHLFQHTLSLTLQWQQQFRWRFCVFAFFCCCFFVKPRDNIFKRLKIDGIHFSHAIVSICAVYCLFVILDMKTNEKCIASNRKSDFAFASFGIHEFACATWNKVAK